MADSQRSLDMDKLSYKIDHMEDLLGYVYIPTTLEELKNLVEVIASTYGTLDKNIELIQQATINNSSTTTSGSSQS